MEADMPHSVLFKDLREAEGDIPGCQQIAQLVRADIVVVFPIVAAPEHPPLVSFWHQRQFGFTTMLILSKGGGTFVSNEECGVPGSMIFLWRFTQKPGSHID